MAIVNTSAVKVQQPECLDDFALQQNSRYKLESILDQTLPFPANGVCGITASTTDLLMPWHDPKWFDFIEVGIS